jgi:hypothetical protein
MRKAFGIKAVDRVYLFGVVDACVEGQFAERGVGRVEERSEKEDVECVI